MQYTINKLTEIRTITDIRILKNPSVRISCDFTLVWKALSIDRRINRQTDMQAGGQTQCLISLEVMIYGWQLHKITHGLKSLGP